jgi:hypothetical protein
MDRLLRVRRERPRRRRAAEQRNEVAPVHERPPAGKDYHIVKSRVCCTSQQK